jgi:lipopolysaccharide export LptBFGC system permease protein LptF
VVIHEKYAIPFASIVFGLLGVALGIRPPRSGRSYSLVKSLAIILAYYILMTAMETLAERGIFPPWLSSWIPNMVFLLMGIYFLILRGLERPSRVMDGLSSLLQTAAARARLTR